MADKLDLEVAVGRYNRLLLDTNLLIHEFKRQANVLAKIPRPQRVTSLVAVWEFVHLQGGQLIAEDERTARRTWVDQQQIRLEWLSPKSEHAFRNLVWRANFPHGVVDCLLAAESMSRKWPLVTRNTKHFDDVPGMYVVPY